MASYSCSLDGGSSDTVVIVLIPDPCILYGEESLILGRSKVKFSKEFRISEKCKHCFFSPYSNISIITIYFVNRQTNKDMPAVRWPPPLAEVKISSPFILQSRKVGLQVDVLERKASGLQRTLKNEKKNNNRWRFNLHLPFKCDGFSGAKRKMLIEYQWSMCITLT